MAWLVGFLGLVPFPYFGICATSVAMVLVARLVRRRNPVAHKVAGGAHMFGVVNLVLLIVRVVLGIVRSLRERSPHGADGSFDALSLALTLVVQPLDLYLVLVGPLIAVIMAIRAAIRPVTADRAHTILASAR